MTSPHHRVVVTGATGGLGRCIAKRFWDAGDDLILIARNEGRLASMAGGLMRTSKEGQKVYSFPADLSDLDGIPSLVQSLRVAAGDPDILVNNAAIQGPIGPLQTNDWSEWQACLTVCLLAPVQLCRLLLPPMIEAGFGRIVNISGGGATSPRPNFSSYATAKCALVRFSETLAREAGPSGITVNCVAPGAMYTGLTEEILRAGAGHAGAAEIEGARLLREQNPRAEERAAGLVHFLTTEQCARVNGKLISAVWDPWERLPELAREDTEGEVYTLRRRLPGEEDRTRG